jgi:hypothetical protein
MLLNDKSLSIICNSRDYIKHQIFHAEKNLSIAPEQKENLMTKINFHKEIGFRTLVFSQQSILNLEYYKVPKDIRVDILKSLPNRKDIIQVGLNCYKYVKTDDRLTVICLKSGLLNENEGGTFTFFFSINLLTGNVFTDNYDYIEKKSIDHNQMIELYYSKFMVVLTYLELTDVELKIVFSKGKSGQSFGSHVLRNDSKKSVIHVTSDWNVEKIIVGEFGVRGHYRWIATDSTRKLFRQVIVRPYTKNLIMRNPQKELV